jgi:uroporphyrinogen III methyltransferase/synthase
VSGGGGREASGGGGREASGVDGREARAAGRVVLVGAGPGAPDLVTVRGLAALRAADVVVYDSLASRELLDEAPPDAERIDVGKRGHADPPHTQEEINELLVARARAGRTVVRLKGGDPFVFGRGGEEASACRRAGIRVEVVPGVTSPIGVLAYAGIPVTDRRHSASFAVVTGHKDPSKAREELDLEGLARSADTLVVLMGMRNLEGIVARVLAAGRAPEPPAAAVMLGTTPHQRTVTAPLAELPARVRAAGLGAPAVIVVGHVVALREELAWFEALPLFGARVLVTRAADQAGPLLADLRAAGAEARAVPMIRIEPAGDAAAVARALADLDAYDAVLFASANAVRELARRAAALGVSLADRRPRIVCVGPATARAAWEAGLRVDAVPGERFDADGLFAALADLLPVAGGRFLLPRAEGGRERLADLLGAAGARAESLVLYRSLPPDLDPAPLRQALAAGDFDTLTFASPSAVRHFAALLDGEARAAAGRCTVAAIGAVTAEALAKAGLPADVVATRAEGPELVAALARHREKQGEER